MQIHKGIENIPAIKNPVVTIGTFDGVHMGHQKIIQRLNDIARQTDGKSVLITFQPHPRLVINPQDTHLRLLNTPEEKIQLLKQYQVHHLVIVEFTREFAQLSAEQYINDFLVAHIHPKKLVIGYDHHFGKNREGNIHLHKKICAKSGYEVEEIPQQLVDDIAVSSTKIRKALLEGNITKATTLLGHPYSIEGVVVKGRQVGTGLGFPTANILVRNTHKLIPAPGVYAVKVQHHDKEYNGMLNIGFNPTFNGSHLSIEVNIFDFSQNIYGENLKIDFVSFLRKEEKYSSPEDLKKQLKKDQENTLKLLTLYRT